MEEGPYDAAASAHDDATTASADKITEQLAGLYAKLEEIRERKEEAQGAEQTPSGGQRVVLVTRRLPRDAHVVGSKRRASAKALDAMDQALTNFRQIAIRRRTLWVGTPDVELEHTGEQRALRERLEREGKYCPVFVNAKRQSLFYNGFCKRVLWPLFHSSAPTTSDTINRVRQPPVVGRVSAQDDAYDEGEAQLWSAYVSTNQAFADVVFDCSVGREHDDVIWIQDYHLMLVPQMLRSLNSEAVIGFFLHVPFPSSELYRTLPFREEILHGILAADLLGFQTYDYARHFLSSCEMVLGIETSPDSIERDGHVTKVCVCPVGIEPDQVRARANSPAVVSAMARLEHQLGGRSLMLGIDTLDPTKGLVHKFLAVEELFERHPELADELVFAQVVVGSSSEYSTLPAESATEKPATVALHNTGTRGENGFTGGESKIYSSASAANNPRVELFSTLERQLHSMVSRINSKLATVDFEGPVQYFAHAFPSEELTALFALADVLVVTPIRDGMNVIPFEYLVARDAHNKLATVLLSEFAGCARSLGGAVLVNPWDTNRFATLLHRLFTRSRRSNNNKDRIVKPGVVEVKQRLSRSSSSSKRVLLRDEDDEIANMSELSESECCNEEEEESDDTGKKRGRTPRTTRAWRQRNWGIERRRAHEHMLQYVCQFTASGWAKRFLDQLQEASETKAVRPWCRELSAKQLVAPYERTQRRLIVLALEGVLAKPTSLSELLTVPVATLEHLRAICRDPRNLMVVVVSARSSETLERVFAPLTAGPAPTSLVLAAEEGLSLRWDFKEGPWELQVSPFDVDMSSWEDDALPLIEYYTTRTPGSVIERKHSGIAWHYRDCDLNHGAWQARQLQVALTELAKHVPVSVFSGDKLIEVRPMRLEVPNVLELALRRLGSEKQHAEENNAFPAAPEESSVENVEPPVVEAAEDDASLQIDCVVDYVLFVASGNDLVDEEIFESMAPPPFDLDEFCARINRLSAGEGVEAVEEVVEEDDESVVEEEPEEPRSTPSSPVSNARRLMMAQAQDANGPLHPTYTSYEQFAAVMTEPEMRTVGKFPIAEKASDDERRADLAARANFKPRRDFPPSAMLFQALKRRYGRDWSRDELPTTPSACWALVGGKAPRRGAPRAERSTFLADFADKTGDNNSMNNNADMENSKLERTNSAESAPVVAEWGQQQGQTLMEDTAASKLSPTKMNRRFSNPARLAPPPQPTIVLQMPPAVAPIVVDDDGPPSPQMQTHHRMASRLRSRTMTPPPLSAAAAVQRHQNAQALLSPPKARFVTSPPTSSELLERSSSSSSSSEDCASPPNLSSIAERPTSDDDDFRDPPKPAVAFAAETTSSPQNEQPKAPDPHEGLDLPLQTFSCIVGIKLSQATYYLKSPESLAVLLSDMAALATAPPPPPLPPPPPSPLDPEQLSPVLTRGTTL